MVTMQLAAVILAVTGAGETALLDFQADWCRPCKAMDPVVGRLAAMGYPVRKVNIEREPGLAQRFGVTRVPCFVVVSGGHEQSRFEGATSGEHLMQMLHQAGVRPTGRAVLETRGKSADGGRRRRPFKKSTSNESQDSLQPPVVSLGEPAELNQSSVAATTTPATAQPSASVGAPPSSVAQSAGPAVANTDPLIGRLLAATVRIRVDEVEGHSFGSGTIIDYRPLPTGQGGVALVLTCAHIFRDRAPSGAVHVDLFVDGETKTVPGQIVKSDLQRDVGLVAFQSARPLQPIALGPSYKSFSKGAEVISIGCDHGGSPKVHRSSVTAINGFVGPPNLQVAGQPAQGRSGGGLFTTDGKLIGVCNFADPTDQAGLYAAIDLAHGLLSDAKWQLASVGNGSEAAPRSLGSVPMAMATSTADRTELICIIRRGEQSKREVIVIDNASSEILQKLSAERRKQSGAIPTAMEVRRPSAGPAPPLEVIRTTTDWQPRWR